MRLTLRFSLLPLCLTVLLACGGLAAAQQAAPSAAAFATASGRSVFWRGERIVLALAVPLTAPVAAVVRLSGPHALAMPIYHGTLQPVGGTGYLNLLLPTQALGDGMYTATAVLAGQTLACTFTLRETTPTSPAMILDESNGGLAPDARQAGLTGAINFMTDGRFNVTGYSMSENAQQLNGIFDHLADEKILFWNQDASRPFSFIPPHSSPKTDGEYLRRLLLGNTIMMRYPAFAGQLFDYDHEGFYLEGTNYANMATYWGWGNLGGDLQQYLDIEEQALIDNYRKTTGKEPVLSAESAHLSSLLHVPEGLGYIDTPTRRWAMEVAARTPALPPAQLAVLKDRAFCWYDYLMSINFGRYTHYLQELRALDPTLMHSTSNTINHSTPRQGGYHPLSYQPLDFRFVAVWDDQGGAPEHIYETQLAATLLNGDRRPEQPLWIDTVFGWQNGNHFRNTVQVVGRGGQGTGYSMEMGSNLGAHAVKDLQTNAPVNQEMALNAQLMQRFGGVFANAHPQARLGLLYSKRQITITPYAQSYCDGMFKMLYLLSHVGLPPSLVTDEMLSAGLPEGMDTIIVLGQTEELPEQAMQGLRAFVAHGGRVLADSATTVRWDFLEHAAALDVPFRDLGHPYNMMTAYNRQDATTGVMRDLATERCPQLRALLQPSINNAPLDALTADVAVATLQGGSGRFVTVTNDSLLDFARLFTREEQNMASIQQLFVGHGLGAIGSWMPLRTNLLLSPALGSGSAIYDLFTMQQVLPLQLGGGRMLPCDLTGAPARIYAIYPGPVGAGRLSALQHVRAGETIDLHYQATDGASVPLAAVVPVEITLRSQRGEAMTTLYRATDAQGSLNESIASGLYDLPGTYELQVRQLLDGQGYRLPITVNAGAALSATPLAGAVVRDPAGIRAFFAGKPELVVPVFDAELQPLAAKVVDALTRQGVQARLWLAPTMVNYITGYTVKAQDQPHNDAVDRGEAIGKVQCVNNVNQLNGNFYGSAMTGFRYGKHILLLSLPGKNPVVQGIQDAGLLWRDNSTEAPSCALVQRLPWALGLQAQTLVVQGADQDGLAAGVDALLHLPADDPVTDGVREARARMLHGHAVPLTYHTPPSTHTLSTNGARPLPAQPHTPRFSLVPVTGVNDMGGTLVVTLGRYCNNIAVLDHQGQVTTLPAISSTPQVACGQTAFFTSAPEMISAWSREGRPLWRAMGSLKGVMPGSDDALVESGSTRYRVAPDGSSQPFTEKLPVAEQAPGGTIQLTFHRFTGEHAVQVADTQAHTSTTITLDTAYLTDAALSSDEKEVALCGMEGGVTIADLHGKVLATLSTGAYPRLFPLRDGGFAIGSSDGWLTVVDAGGHTRFTRDLIALTAGANPDDAYRLNRETKLLNWSNPPVLQGPLPAENFYWYLRDEQNELRLVNQDPATVIDFRWMDVVQGDVQIPAAKSYTVTLRAAAKYFDEQPLAQPSWKNIVDLRNAVVKNERPAPAFRLYLDGKPLAVISPDGGALHPFVTPPIKEGWATLRPKEEELTTFTTTLDLPAGRHLLGLEALNMEDCYVKEFAVK